MGRGRGGGREVKASHGPCEINLDCQKVVPEYRILAHTPVKSDEVRVVGIHVGELYLNHQLDLRERERQYIRYCKCL